MERDKEQPKIVFESAGNPTYRIPALIYIDDCKTFFAFAEKRKSEKDVDAEVLVMRKGKRQNEQIDWSLVEVLTSAHMPGYRTMNPCPVYEKESKTLFLFFICVKHGITEEDQINQRNEAQNTTRLGYITSKDSGKSWSRMTNLTDTVIGGEINRWATFAVGPGHGIQMKSGRLVIPAYVYYIEYKFCCWYPTANPYALAFYSDDKGQNWKMTKKLQLKTLECQMAEIYDQSGKNYLYCNARSTASFRTEACSENFASAEWEMCNPELPETGQGCQGSVLSFSVPGTDEGSSSTSSTNTWLLYSHPSDHDKRKDLGIYLKKTPLSTPGWEKPWIIYDDTCAYSDLTQCEGQDRFACLFEYGYNDKLEEICFAEFSLSDVMKRK